MKSIVYHKRLIIFICCLSVVFALEAQTEKDTLVPEVEYEEVYEEDYDYEGDDYYEEEEDVYDGNIFLFDIMLGVMKPQGAFGMHQSENHFDFNMMVWYQYRMEKPFFLGGGFSINQLQSYRAQVERVFDGVFEVWNGRTATYAVGFHVGGKYIIDIGTPSVVPFIEGLAGINLLYTSTTFTFNDTDESDSITNRRDAALSYGGAFGVNIAVSEKAFLTAKSTFLTGLAIDYDVVDPDYNGILPPSTYEAFELKNTTTDMLKLDFGVTFVF